MTTLPANLTTSEDDYIREMQDDRALALWQARLSDGTVVTMDDARPGVEEQSAWIRLGRFLQTSNLRIEKMWLKFRTNVDHNILPENADGYFFSKNALGEMLAGSATHMFYLVGAVVDGNLDVHRFNCPSLMLVDVERRSVDGIGDALIWNPKCETGKATT